MGASWAKKECPRLLTAGNRARSGLLEVFERRVYLEGLREMLGALSTHLVVAEAANEVENGPSGAIDATATAMLDLTTHLQSHA
jgi:hypothetical protein